MSHHGNIPESEGDDKKGSLVEALRDEAKKLGLGSTGKFPRGKIEEKDEGQLAIGVTLDTVTRTVILNFGKPVEWIGFSPEEGRILARLILSKANEAVLK